MTTRAYNSIVAKFFRPVTYEPIVDPSEYGKKIVIQGFSSIYPGGDASCTFSIMRDPLAPLPFTGGDVVRIYNAATLVWEGFINGIAYLTSEEGSGTRVTATGTWGWYVMTRTKEKRWADNRLDASTWYESGEPYDAYDITMSRLFHVNRTPNRVRITPKSEAFAANAYHRLRYSMPTGETIKRIKMSYSLQEAAQAWSMGLFNEASVNAVWFRTVSGSGGVDDTLTTPTRHAFMFFNSNVAQTPTSDGTYFCQFDDGVSGGTRLMVYSETGNINAYEVFRDVRAMVPELSTDESYISSGLNVTVEPFITNGREALSSILARIAGYGTPSYGPIGYGVKPSTYTSDGKPGLFAEAWPSLSTADYVISVRDPNVSDKVEVVRDYSGIYNWIAVEFTDPSGDLNVWTPDDDASLKDADSIARYGERHLPSPLRIGNATSTNAVQHGRNFLNAYKDPRVYVRGAIVVKGRIRGATGSFTPVSHVRAGERVKIADFISDVLDQAGVGMTAVITAAEYTDSEGGAVRLSFGVPDNIAILLARLPEVRYTQPWTPANPGGRSSRD